LKDTKTNFVRDSQRLKLAEQVNIYSQH